MKDIQLYYWLGMQNFGDALNIDLCKKLFNINPVMSTPEECEATFIGSTLDDFLFRGLKRFSKKYQGNINKPPIKIWGSGFIAPKNKFCRRLFNLDEQYFRTIDVKAVRGDLSRKRLEKISNQNLNDVLLADAGLLAKDLKTTPIIKKYKFGVIPHHMENDVVEFDWLVENLENAIKIPMDIEAVQSLELISQCDFILSSAMHGLIVADSFGIPNIRLVASKRLIGGDYKFDDYYSSYGIKNKYYNIDEIQHMDNVSNFVIDNYRIKQEVVKEKINGLYKTFPYK